MTSARESRKGCWNVVKSTLPRSVKRWLRMQQRRWRRWKALGWVRLGIFRHLTPASRVFGLDRGQPVDRHYIEIFMQDCSADIRGRVLEIGKPIYTNKFGGDRVAHSDVLHVLPGNPQATMIGDLATGQGIPEDTFDCMILTQTFLCIYDVRAAIANAHAALKPGGVLLASFPGISQISRYDMDRWGDYWRFTDASTRRLFGEAFGVENVKIRTFGNVLAACAYLHGLASYELKRKELAYHDPDYQVVIAVRATKPVEGN